jgi:hypothetical protein
VASGPVTVSTRGAGAPGPWSAAAEDPGMAAIAQQTKSNKQRIINKLSHYLAPNLRVFKKSG